MEMQARRQTNWCIQLILETIEYLLFASRRKTFVIEMFKIQVVHPWHMSARPIQEQ